MDGRPQIQGLVSHTFHLEAAATVSRRLLHLTLPVSLDEAMFPQQVKLLHVLHRRAVPLC
jgi:hypothetical protein